MLNKEQHAVAAQTVLSLLIKAGIAITKEENNEIEYADFGLGRFDEIGLALIVYVNTKKVCAKELIMLPGQICPEHRHPPIDNEPGKEETFRLSLGRGLPLCTGTGNQQAKSKNST